MVAMTSDAPLLTLTDTARAQILEIRAGEPEPESLALWLEVSGVQGNAFTYDMYFRPVAEAVDGDVVLAHDDLPVVVPELDVPKVTGSTLDVQGGGMVLKNPNSPQSLQAAMPPPDLDSPLAQRVLEVLETQINPAIASHGGRADLVAVEEPIVYLRLSGGCQGCGMASVTLSQGIEVAILDTVPEITQVVDVTDHASGENPYFEKAKK